ncbi:MAG: ferrous iron transporter B, partial [Phycisphaerales bacterium]|nr:ferrous iron transporter B [Phycisphaerales bacterium]
PGVNDERRPDAICVVVDAANLSRNLRLVGEVIRLGLPLVVVLNRFDQALKRGLRINTDGLGLALGCEVLCTDALRGEGVESVPSAIDRARTPPPLPDGRSLKEWADSIVERCTDAPESARSEVFTDRLDDVFTHPALGTLVFMVVMTGLFWVVFKLATWPMDWIDAGFAAFGEGVAGALPAGAIRSLLVDGVIGGVGATVVFLPQICLMFFLITLLEQSGYLPRAALLVDRLFRPFGLPGQAFVPLLSSHACAIPGIIACRGIPDRRERIATILVAPFMSCTARIPVYVLLTSILFADRPGFAAIAFTGCYVLGAATALLTAAVFRRTFLKGDARPMALELPGYRRPSVRQALVSTLDRGLIFLRKAGTVILGMMVALWWLGTYPIADPPPESIVMRERALSASSPRAAELIEEADRLDARHASAHSFMGRTGRAIAPAFEPLGYDWQLTVGVLSSFAAREVFVSTMAVVLAAGEDAGETESGLRRIETSTRDDGVTPVFSRPASWSLLVFYVLAMQCLPTLAVTAREAGGWRWAGLQFAYMTALAYLGGAIAFNAAIWLG